MRRWRPVLLLARGRHGDQVARRANTLNFVVVDLTVLALDVDLVGERATEGRGQVLEDGEPPPCNARNRSGGDAVPHERRPGLRSCVVWWWPLPAALGTPVGRPALLKRADALGGIGAVQMVEHVGLD